jgi:carboxylesterase type B
MGSIESNKIESEVYVQIGQTNVRGFTSSLGVGNYLGLPFATINRRFGLAKLVKQESLSASTIDATHYGPRCPQPTNFGRLRRPHLYTGIDDPTNIPTAEFGCLRLNIYTPESAKPDSKLPVLVWIHGGGWVFGDGSSEYGKFTQLLHCYHIRQG